MTKQMGHIGHQRKLPERRHHTRFCPSITKRRAEDFAANAVSSRGQANLIYRNFWKDSKKHTCFEKIGETFHNIYFTLSPAIFLETRHGNGDFFCGGDDSPTRLFEKNLPIPVLRHEENPKPLGNRDPTTIPVPNMSAKRRGPTHCNGNPCQQRIGDSDRRSLVGWPKAIGLHAQHKGASDSGTAILKDDRHDAQGTGNRCVGDG
jgi:hypothetical protein